MTTQPIKIDFAKANLAPHGKRLVAHAMFHKGKHFLAASVLLDKNHGYQDVVLHLIAQGLEVAQKGLLLAKDYDKFEPELRKIGHDLLKGSDAFTKAYGLKPIRGKSRKELESLSEAFRTHTLRYGSILDVLGGPPTVSVDLIGKKGLALVKFGNRVFAQK